MIQVRAKTVEGRTWLPKTRVNRTVPISSALMEYLRRYKPNKSVPWYFPSPQDSCWWDPDNLSRRLRRLNNRAGLPWGCLDFRHTFGSHLAMKGQSLYKISKIMGNSPEICRRHYAALTPESLVGSVEFDDAPPPDPIAAGDSQPQSSHSKKTQS
jgi:integrase